MQAGSPNHSTEALPAKFTVRSNLFQVIGKQLDLGLLLVGGVVSSEVRGEYGPPSKLKAVSVTHLSRTKSG